MSNQQKDEETTMEARTPSLEKSQQQAFYLNKIQKQRIRQTNGKINHKHHKGAVL
jgi:hypothetical protein